MQFNPIKCLNVYIMHKNMVCWHIPCGLASSEIILLHNILWEITNNFTCIELKIFLMAHTYLLGIEPVH